MQSCSKAERHRMLTRCEHIVGGNERFFPDSIVQANKRTDYKYRAKVSWEALANVLHDQAMAVDYSNFKSSVHERKRHENYIGVWLAMYSTQEH